MVAIDYHDDLGAVGPGQGASTHPVEVRDHPTAVVTTNPASSSQTYAFPYDVYLVGWSVTAVTAGYVAGTTPAKFEICYYDTDGTLHATTGGGAAAFANYALGAAGDTLAIGKSARRIPSAPVKLYAGNGVYLRHEVTNAAGGAAGQVYLKLLYVRA